MMTQVLFIVVLVLAGGCFAQCVAAAEPAQKVRIGYPSSAVSTLPFDIARCRVHPNAHCDRAASDPQW